VEVEPGVAPAFDRVALLGDALAPAAAEAVADALALGATPELRCYERWHGQLALFGNMEELVSALVNNPLELRQPDRDFKADVALMLPQLIAVYRQ